MNQNNPETYALTARCPIDDAAKLRALARSRGITPSALVAQLIHAAVVHATPQPDDITWAGERRLVNRQRRQLQDARTQSGFYRKPGWENLSISTDSKPDQI